MKKLLSIILCGLLLLTSLSACNNESDNSSEASSQQPVSSETENMSALESSEEENTSVESSEASEEWVAPEPYVQTVKAPEKTVYFKGNYGPIQNDDARRRLFGIYVQERGYDIENSISEYINKNNPSDDTYFMVRVAYKVHINNSTNGKTPREITLGILKDYDYIDIDDHPLIEDFQFYFDLEELVNSNPDNIDEEIQKLFWTYTKNIYAQILPEISIETLKEIDDEYGNISAIHALGFYTVGYISVGALKELAKLEFPEGDYIEFLWCPAPDDQERWFTLDGDYKLD